jgi:hypothetical protein
LKDEKEKGDMILNNEIAKAAVEEISKDYGTKATAES